MSLKDAFASIENNHRNKIQNLTFGHLFPKGTKYKGRITIAYGIYGDIIVLNEEININSSPWWKQAVDNFACEMIETMEQGTTKTFSVQVIISPTKEPPNQIKIKTINR